MVKQSEKKLAEKHLRLKVVVCLLLSSFPGRTQYLSKVLSLPLHPGISNVRRRGQPSCHSCHNREPRTKKESKSFCGGNEKILAFPYN